MHTETYSMKDAVETRLTAFEELLRAEGVEIRSGSHFERLALNVVDVYDKHLQPESQDSMTDIRGWLREIVGMNHLIALVLDVVGHSSFPQLVPHLRLLNDATTTQNERSLVTDPASNKLFELVVACSAMRAGYDATLDDPDHSAGDNPDVLIEVSPDARFGVACKALHSRHPQTILDNISKAIDQIDASPANRGVVALNLKNLFPHDEFFPVLNEDEWHAGQAEPIFGAWNDQDALLRKANEAADEIINVLGDDAVLADLQAHMGRSVKVVQGLLFYVPTAVGVKMGGSALPTNFGFIKLRLIDGALPPADQAILEALNRGMHIA